MSSGASGAYGVPSGHGPRVRPPRPPPRGRAGEAIGVAHRPGGRGRGPSYCLGLPRRPLLPRSAVGRAGAGWLVHSGHGRRPGPAGRRPRQRGGRAARLAEPPRAGLLRGHRVRHPPPRPLRGRRATRFTRHVTGSLPCMPARHDILCGALDFLWKPWGSIELWERPDHRRPAGRGRHHHAGHRPPPPVRDRRRELPHRLLRLGLRAGPRGRPVAHPRRPVAGSARPAPPARDGGWFWRRLRGEACRVERAYDRTRTWFRAEEDYPGPRTMAAAADWLRRAAPQHDRWLLFVDEFDPHEPFDTPPPWLGPLRGRALGRGAASSGRPTRSAGSPRACISEAEARHLRANYGAKLSMIDHWFGRVLAALDERGPVGLHRGRRVHRPRPLPGRRRGAATTSGASPASPSTSRWATCRCWSTGRACPGAATCDALTTSVDLHATLADVFGVAPGHRTHGRSLLPLLAGDGASVREWAIGGVWGNWVQVTDGRRKYARAPVGGNRPLSMWSNRWSTMPLHMAGVEDLPPPDDRADARLHARLHGPGDPPALRPRRPAALLGRPAGPSQTTSTTSTSTPTRPRTGPGEAGRARHGRPAPHRAGRGRGPGRPVRPAGASVTSRSGCGPRSRRPGTRAGGLVVLPDDHAPLDRRGVAPGPLDHAAAAGRQVVDQLRRLDRRASKSMTLTSAR